MPGSELHGDLAEARRRHSGRAHRRRRRRRRRCRLCPPGRAGEPREGASGPERASSSSRSTSSSSSSRCPSRRSSSSTPRSRTPRRRAVGPGLSPRSPPSLLSLLMVASLLSSPPPPCAQRSRRARHFLHRSSARYSAVGAAVPFARRRSRVRLSRSARCRRAVVQKSDRLSSTREGRGESGRALLDTQRSSWAQTKTAQHHPWHPRCFAPHVALTRPPLSRFVLHFARLSGYMDSGFINRTREGS